jgi:hypothetical protein
MKEDDYTYHLRFTSPENMLDIGEISFTYYYGKHNTCIYNVKAQVFIVDHGEGVRLLSSWPGHGEWKKSALNPKSTSDGCPPLLHFYFEDTSPEQATLILDE